MGPSVLQKIAVAAGYALLAGFGAIQMGGVPATVEGWVALAGTVVVAFWGKFSSSRTIISAKFTG
jgi:hypothetical protein